MRNREYPMTYQALSTRSIHALHQGIHRALAADNARPPHLREYGVRVFPDWTVHSRALEATLASRGEAFTPTGL